MSASTAENTGSRAGARAGTPQPLCASSEHSPSAFSAAVLPPTQHSVYESGGEQEHLRLTCRTGSTQHATHLCWGRSPRHSAWPPRWRCRWESQWAACLHSSRLKPPMQKSWSPHRSHLTGLCLQRECWPSAISAPLLSCLPVVAAVPCMMIVHSRAVNRQTVRVVIKRHIEAHLIPGGHVLEVPSVQEGMPEAQQMHPPPLPVHVIVMAFI